jgi:hypothetical protein
VSETTLRVLALLAATCLNLPQQLSLASMHPQMRMSQLFGSMSTGCPCAVLGRSAYNFPVIRVAT